MTQGAPSRRAIMRGALAGAAISPGAIWSLLQSAPALAQGLPDAKLRPGLCVVADLVLPATPPEEHGAAAASALGVADFVLLSAAHGLGGAHPDTLHRLFQALDTEAGGAFLKLAALDRLKTLSRLDRAAFASREATAHSPWAIVKALILMGYYTSAQGGGVELRYELVPGRYDSDIACTPQTLALSSDWTGTSFK